jgi:hypothetical protein
MNTAAHDATGASYPIAAGSKAPGASNSAALGVDRDPDRKMTVYVRIVIHAILESAKVIDQIADAIGEMILYARPRCSELIALGVLQKGAQRIASHHGRSAHTVLPSDALAEYIGMHDPDDLDRLEKLVESFIHLQQVVERKAQKLARTGQV